MDAYEPGDIIQKKSMRDEVFEYLHRRILAGKYAPGEWLRQEELAVQLGVSQTPVREALDYLVAAGLAERIPYRGVRVPQLSTQEILDAYALRLLLESTAARLAAHHISREQLGQLSLIVEQTHALVTLDDMSTLRQLNKKFHLLLVEASGNALLYRLYATVLNTFPDWMLYEYMFRHPELLQSSLQREYLEHTEILQALASQDGDRAVQKIVIHIRNLGLEFETFLGIPGSEIVEREQQIAPLLVQQS